MGAAVAITRLDLPASELRKAIPYQWLRRYQTTCPRTVLVVWKSFRCSTQDNNRAAGMTGTKHSPAEIAAMLRQADELAAQGKRRSEILRALQISPMTYHRWRKNRSSVSLQPERRASHASDASAAGGPLKIDAGSFAALTPREQIIAFQELQRENVRLRELFTDALLEKIKLEEELWALRSAHRTPGATVA